MVTEIKFTNTRTGREEKPTITVPTDGSKEVWKHETLSGHDGGAGSYIVTDRDGIGAAVIEETFRPPDQGNFPQGAKPIPILSGKSHELFVYMEGSSPQRVKVTVSHESRG